MTDLTRPIRELFPDRKDIIVRLAATDGEFSELCDDFDTCVAAWRHWSGSDESDAHRVAGEYREILEDLYGEIQRHLACAQSRVPGRGH